MTIGFSQKMEAITDAYDTFAEHYRRGNLNWPMIIFISLAHVAGNIFFSLHFCFLIYFLTAIIGLYTIPHCHTYTLMWAFFLWPVSGNGITGGVHRLWAHRSYKASFPLRVFLMLSNSMANQGSIWHWSRDHRVHHKHSEVPKMMYFLSPSLPPYDLIVCLSSLSVTLTLTMRVEDSSSLMLDGCW